MWRDPKTNLVWMRCSLGQVWDGNTCTGEAKKYTWQEAMDAAKALNNNGGFGGYRDWVVPHIEELFSLVRCDTGFTDSSQIPAKSWLRIEKDIQKRCKGSNYKHPTIDQVIFPNTRNASYLSAFPNEYDGYYAWRVEFDSGDTYKSREPNFYVRAVRAR